MTDHALASRGEDFDLREHVSTVLPDQLPCLGLNRGQMRHELNLADYVATTAPQVPSAVHRDNPGHVFPMYLNDKLGDCGPAMVVHGNECFHLDAGTPVPKWADRDVEKFYEQVGGYVPGKPETDQGVANDALVEKWKGGKLVCGADESKHTIVASAYVNPKVPALNERAIWEFVALFRAVALPVTAQGQKEWAVTDPSLSGDAAPGSWGGHDIPYVSYDGKRYRNITWGTELLVEYAFDHAYAEEGFVVITEEMLSNTGISPAGINWTALVHDIKAL